VILVAHFGRIAKIAQRPDMQGPTLAQEVGEEKRLLVVRTCVRQSVGENRRICGPLLILARAQGVGERSFKEFGKGVGSDEVGVEPAPRASISAASFPTKSWRRSARLSGMYSVTSTDKGPPTIGMADKVAVNLTCRLSLAVRLVRARRSRSSAIRRLESSL
jgi:hypothetical protein